MIGSCGHRVARSGLPGFRASLEVSLISQSKLENLSIYMNHHESMKELKCQPGWMMQFPSWTALRSVSQVVQLGVLWLQRVWRWVEPQGNVAVSGNFWKLHHRSPDLDAPSFSTHENLVEGM